MRSRYAYIAPMTTTTNKQQFNSYDARLVTGEPVLVINRNDNATLKSTGEKVCALKIRERVIVGYKGWSGGCYPVYGYNSPRWVRSELVVI